MKFNNDVVFSGYEADGVAKAKLKFGEYFEYAFVAEKNAKTVAAGTCADQCGNEWKNSCCATI